MNKIISIILALACSFSVLMTTVGCGTGGGENETSPYETEDDTTETEKGTDEETEKGSDEETDKEQDLKLPLEYEPVIENYKKIIEMRLSENFEENWNNGAYKDTYDGYYDDEIIGNFDTMIVEMLLPGAKVTSSSYGYVLKDINGDDVLELFWVSSDLRTVFAVFTLSGRDVQLLDAFWSRYKCCVTDEGELYTFGSSAADVFSYHIRRLEPHSAELISVKEFGADREYAPDGEGKNFYYEAQDLGADHITKDRYKELVSEYPFENGGDWKKSAVAALHEYYYLTDISEANLVCIKLPKVGYDDLINCHVASFLNERYNFGTFKLDRTEKQNNELFNRFGSQDYTDYYIEITADTVNQTDELISIKFQGLVNYKTAAHPNHILFTLNIDPLTGKRIMFTDTYNVNEDLYSVFLRYAQAEMDDVAGVGAVSVEEQLCTMDSFIKGIANESTVCVYYSGESIVMSYEVPFAVGGYREARVPISELSEFEK